MRRSFRLAMFSVSPLLGVLSAIAQNAPAQDPASAETPQAEVMLIKLSPPVYPPLARQARIMGDVKVQILVRPDGSVESAEVISGHPMLKQAALDSANASRFECRSCSDAGSYSMTYTFGFHDGGCRDVIEERPARSPKCLYLWKCGVRSFSTWHPPEYRPPEVTQSPDHVTILVSSSCLETLAAH